MHLAGGGRCALREPLEAGGEGGEPFVVLGNGTVRGAAAGEDPETAAAAGEAAGKAAEKALDDGLTPEAAAAAGKAAGDAIIAGADIEIAPWTGEHSPRHSASETTFTRHLYPVVWACHNNRRAELRLAREAAAVQLEGARALVRPPVKAAREAAARARLRGGAAEQAAPLPVCLERGR